MFMGAVLLSFTHFPRYARLNFIPHPNLVLLSVAHFVIIRSNRPGSVLPFSPFQLDGSKGDKWRIFVTILLPFIHA